MFVDELFFSVDDIDNGLEVIDIGSLMNRFHLNEL